jgi:smad nuclear-interacting protein 1
MILGLLAAATNSVKHSDGTSTVLKYNEPPEARKPVSGWRLYVFKGKEQIGASRYHFLSLNWIILIYMSFNVLDPIELLHIYSQSAYLIGRDQAIADIPIEHPSCSKQHAVIQFRQVNVRNVFGDTTGSVKYVIIDMISTSPLFPSSSFHLYLSIHCQTFRHRFGIYKRDPRERSGDPVIPIL